MWNLERIDKDNGPGANVNTVRNVATDNEVSFTEIIIQLNTMILLLL